MIQLYKGQYFCQVPMTSSKCRMLGKVHEKKVVDPKRIGHSDLLYPEFMLSSYLVAHGRRRGWELRESWWNRAGDEVGELIVLFRCGEIIQ